MSAHEKNSQVQSEQPSLPHQEWASRLPYAATFLVFNPLRWKIAANAQHGQLASHMIEALPEDYSHSGQIIDHVIGEAFQLYVNIPKTTLPKPMKETIISLLSEHADLFSLIRSEVTSLLDTQLDPHVFESSIWPVPHEADAKKTFIYLGYESEQEFLENMPHQMEKKLREYKFSESHIDRYKKTMEFVSDVYKEYGIDRRKSGEAYLCHVFRVCWYYLTSQEEKGSVKKRKNHSEILQDLQLLLLHDIPEDIEGATIWESCLHVPRKKGLQFISLTKQQSISLAALTSDDGNRNLQKVIRDDPSGKAAELKLYDRLDNILTLWHKKTWRELFAKLYETYSSTAALAWTSLMGDRVGLIKKMDNYCNLSLHYGMESSLAVNLISLGMFAAATEGMRRRVEEQLLEKYGIVLEDDGCREWQQKKTREFRGLGVSELLDRFSLRRMVRDFAMIKREKREPFDFRDMYPYRLDAKNIIADRYHSHHFYPLGKYDTMQNIDILELFAATARFGMGFPYVPEKVIVENGKDVVLYYRKKIAHVGNVNYIVRLNTDSVSSR